MTLHTGDCIDVMPTLAAGSVDAVVTDPPYNLTSGNAVYDLPLTGAGNPRERRPRGPSGGFMGKAWDGTGIAFDPATWEAVGRVARPGAYLLAFGGTRTVHRMTCAIEDAGWVIRDVLVWGYAQGFPKSRASLKPAWEPIVMARKPGLSAPLQIDAARIGVEGGTRAVNFVKKSDGRLERWDEGPNGRGRNEIESLAAGRWPANVVLTDPIFDGDMPGVVGGGSASNGGEPTDVRGRGGIWHDGDGVPAGPQYGDTGTYSRFFLIPKADRAEREPLLGGLPLRTAASHNVEGRDMTNPRNGMGAGEQRRIERGEPAVRPRANHHPTVKPLDLMRHLVRLVTPPGGTVLDPFLGSGTTAIACEMEGFPWIGIEREPEYVAIAEARLMGVQRGMGLVS